jgi:hypothetical protein
MKLLYWAVVGDSEQLIVLRSSLPPLQIMRDFTIYISLFMGSGTDQRRVNIDLSV